MSNDKGPTPVKSGGMRTFCFTLVLCLATCLVSCSKPEAPATQAEASPSTQPPAPPQREEEAVPRIEACSLLTSEEIEAVQGEPLKETKPSEKSDRGIVLSECFFVLPTFSNSVTLTLGQRGTAPGSRGVMQFWDESFVSAKDQPKVGPARKITGLGDDAYWLGDERMGALFVLKGSRYFRISVGGPGNQEAKTERSRKLAEKALTRL